MLLIGIDVGGTYIKYGLIENNKIIRSLKLSTNAFDIIKQLGNGVRELLQNEGRDIAEVSGIGVGFPGMVVGQMVCDSPNIGLQNCNLVEILEEELGRPVKVVNDAEMATLAEHGLGAGEKCNNMILLTFGTGLGGGIIIDGKLYAGKGGSGEFGHVLMEQNGKPCPCGRKGCAEQYISMIALDKLAKEMMNAYPNTCLTKSSDGYIYASELMRAYKNHDECAIQVLTKYVDLVTSYLLDICNLFRPERIVIGGGITHAPELISMIASSCKEKDFGMKNSPKVDIVPAVLGNDAGILGTIMCFQNTSDNVETSVDQTNYVAVDETQNTSEDNNNLLESFVEASREEDEPVYDENLLNRVNEMLKKKD